MAKYKQRVSLHPEQDAPARKSFEGKRYDYHAITLTKRGAIKKVNELRKLGYFARVARWAGTWVIYKRKR
ncbi:unnamed protein product [marine sediment metagenome]|uniref:Uncharacterized protein n=1 Tax=marine sediment metagenome TaxID=412755 RepID=X0VU44_9ZZZZ